MPEDDADLDFESQAARYFEQQLSDDDDNDDDEVDETPSGDDETPPAEDDTTPPPPESEILTLSDGRQVTRTQAEEYLRFVDYLQQNPAAAENVSKVLQGGYELRPVTPSDTTESDDDDDDTTLPGSAKIRELEQRLAAQESVVQSQVEASTRALINKAEADFASRHNLGGEEMKQVEAVATRLGVLPSFMSGIDPITGNPTDPDPLKAFENTFNLALQALPDLRQKVEQASSERQKQERQKKRKLSSLAGSSGSTPRTPAQPNSPEERRAAMINDIAQAMNKE